VLPSRPVPMSAAARPPSRASVPRPAVSCGRRRPDRVPRGPRPLARRGSRPPPPPPHPRDAGARPRGRGRGAPHRRAHQLPRRLIIAFIGGQVLAQFGAQIFVADAIGIIMVRELGPIMTAIMVAGRSGSAFAAELGTMRVNEEIDALETMGLPPSRSSSSPAPRRDPRDAAPRDLRDGGGGRRRPPSDGALGFPLPVSWGPARGGDDGRGRGDRRHEERRVRVPLRRHRLPARAPGRPWPERGRPRRDARRRRRDRPGHRLRRALAVVTTVLGV